MGMVLKTLQIFNHRDSNHDDRFLARLCRANCGTSDEQPVPLEVLTLNPDTLQRAPPSECLYSSCKPPKPMKVKIQNPALKIIEWKMADTTKRTRQVLQTGDRDVAVLADDAPPQRVHHLV